ncbi:unnamed protein product [Urochloa humidicola]
MAMAKPIHVLVLLALISLISSLPVSDAQTNITSDASVQAAPGAGWPSPSGHFTFGFYATDGGLAVGIWLATTPNITVTWTIDRNFTPATGGALRIMDDGRLLWAGANGQEYWIIADPPQPAVAAAMRDDGNFVLYGANGAVVWSTFEAPRDTLLPGQDLVPGAQLFSSISDTNRATGKYRLVNQLNDGNIVMYPVQTENHAAAAYWDTNTSRIGFPLTLRLDATGVLYITGNSGNYTKNLTLPGAPKQASEKEVFYWVTLDPDGILRLYRHAVASTGVWTTDVRWIGPRDRCHVKGVCGLNSYCVLDRDAQPSCVCPPGFHIVDAANAALGCSETSGAGDCAAAAAGLTTVTMQNMSWADRPYGVPDPATGAAACQAACMADCLCAAALHNSDYGTCTKQQLPLLYGRAGGAYTLFVKQAVGPAGNSAGSRVGRAATIALICIGTLTCVSMAALLAAARLFWASRRAAHRRLADADAEDPDALELEEEEAPLRSYRYQELEHATCSFREPLGRGAFGTVFRGSLHSGHTAIAVKRLDKVVEEGEREFQREVRAIGRTNHRNLVRLLGFCQEGANRLLVYEYMSNGSLAERLFCNRGGGDGGGGGSAYPSWGERMGIALDVARGLHYLHDELERRVIHCDVKPQNILMDASGTAKIADFGLAKLMLPDQTRTFTGVRGTRGYLAPEWYRGVGPLTVKADVYSYGVVLLETVTCRRSMELEEAGENRTLMELAHEWLLSGEVKLEMASDEGVDAAEVERAVKVAVWWGQAEPQARPAMRTVILMLEGHLEVPFPPPPASS